MENLKIKEYKIIEEYDKEDLEEKVKNSIILGWQPFGNLLIYFYPNSGNQIFVQAMIKFQQI